jgi:hypothetical protein
MREYTPADYPQLAGWYESRGLKPPRPDQLPSIGFIVDGVCAGFLYQTDSSIALIEGLVSNQAIGTTLRGESLHLVLSALCKAAKDKGFRTCYGFTQLDAVKARAESTGATCAQGGFKLLVKEM